MTRNFCTALEPDLMAKELPAQFPSMKQQAMVKPRLQRTEACQMKETVALTLEARLNAFAVADAAIRSIRRNQWRHKIRMLPVPGPKKPS